ncbi:MarR family transcriptional regulator [Gordonia hongkongensis]|uniref:MarR family transcriptional regulator n=1 Tax=Gordonia hongkongensis TaxID=1701090 RepID=A0AAX3T9H2_9ACTN|nr:MULTISPECIES: MarR family transcriptional regulator [Gordonia]OCW86887.1 MarR family transcriptional regulator [Nocardia farcinica]QIK49587.1 MarR family transcriptional regulator [Gordonia terrae]MCX2755867.1 MarR family transcriptional regulator [Gordonia sp. 4N]MDF6102127.1 MarR family transcriptional regulator [Gordonia hongkongensis]WFP25486.1 MarR family transcriptional regulator [Gordonia hongkongensis]
MNELALDQQLCFALYKASRAATAVYRPLLAELGITYPQYLVLLALWDQDGRYVNELSEQLELDTGTLSPLLKRLEAQQLIDRRRSPEDERRVTVHLTPSGTALRTRARAIPRLLGSCTNLSTDEMNDLRSTLDSLTARLHQSM